MIMEEDIIESGPNQYDCLQLEPFFISSQKYEFKHMFWNLKIFQYLFFPNYIMSLLQSKHAMLDSKSLLSVLKDYNNY